MTPSPLSGLWAYFDAIYCISLSGRPDRRQSAAVQFARVGLADRVEFLIAEKHPVDAEQGIYESHMACLRKGIATGARSVLIFEDDVVFDRFDAAVLAGCIDFLTTTPTWRSFFFGCLVFGSRRTKNRAVLKVRYRSLAHAYAVERRLAEKLVRQPWRNLPFDTLLRHTVRTAHAAYPAFAFQSDSRSDNSNRPLLEQFRRLCGGLARIQKMNEWFHYHRLAIVGLHLLVIAFMLILFLRT
ncbi:MAG: glycosyltransferase [Desulfobacterales bacterium]